MPSTVGPVIRIDYLSDLSETKAGIQVSSPVRSVTGSYYPEVIGTATSEPSRALLEIPIDSKSYGTGKPRRIVMRGKIIRDQDQSQE